MVTLDRFPRHSQDRLAPARRVNNRPARGAAVRLVAETSLSFLIGRVGTRGHHSKTGSVYCRENPKDLLRSDNTKVPKNELPFVLVAYGLSVIDLAIPLAATPDQVPPLPRRDPRARLDKDDIYAK